MAHRPNIFREVRDYRKDVSNRLNDDVYSDSYDLEKRRLDALDELLRFLKSLSYIKHSDTKERMETYFKSGLNCRTTASKLGIDNVNVVEQTVKNASDKAKRILAKSLNQIMQAKNIDTIEEAVQRFRESSDQPGTYGYFVPGISRFLPQPKYHPSLTLWDCKKELSRIGVYAHFAEHVLTKDCDQTKLAHILSLVSSRHGSANDREALNRFFSGEFSLSDSGEVLSIMQQVNQMLKWLSKLNPYSDQEEAEYDVSDAD